MGVSLTQPVNVFELSVAQSVSCWGFSQRLGRSWSKSTSAGGMVDPPEIIEDGLVVRRHNTRDPFQVTPSGGKKAHSGRSGERRWCLFALICLTCFLLIRAVRVAIFHLCVRYFSRSWSALIQEEPWPRLCQTIPNAGWALSVGRFAATLVQTALIWFVQGAFVPFLKFNTLHFFLIPQ